MSIVITRTVYVEGDSGPQPSQGPPMTYEEHRKAEIRGARGSSDIFGYRGSW
jgi:hypothetical protein